MSQGCLGRGVPRVVPWVGAQAEGSPGRLTGAGVAGMPPRCPAHGSPAHGVSGGGHDMFHFKCFVLLRHEVN